jgi:hypothetical protein
MMFTGRHGGLDRFFIRLLRASSPMFGRAIKAWVVMQFVGPLKTRFFQVSNLCIDGFSALLDLNCPNQSRLSRRCD